MLEFLAWGPFVVIYNDVIILLLRTRSGDQRLWSARLIKAGASSDLLPEMQAFSRPSAAARPSPGENPYDEFVIECFLSYVVNNDSIVVMRVR
jgi:hypothetical protein